MASTTWPQQSVFLSPVGLGTPYHIRASEGWPVPNELPTLGRRSIDLFFAQKNLFDFEAGGRTLVGICVF